MESQDDRIREILAQLKRGLKSLHGERLCRAVLFGSRARGDNGPDSGIDVLVVLKPPFEVGEETTRTRALTWSLSHDSDCVVRCTFMDEDQWNLCEDPLTINVNREGVAA
jgi:predicted nucleotidyltransferase